MRRVFYTVGGRDALAPTGGIVNDDSESELETEIEDLPAPDTTRKKTVHRRSESMDVNAGPEVANAMGTAPKRPRRLGNPIVRQRQVSREIRDATGQRPLQKACSKGDLARVRQLLDDKPDLQDRDYAGTTALHTACVQGYADIVKELIGAGAVVDVRSGPEELDTPLVDAVANGNYGIVQLLLRAGADPRVTNAVGRIAIDFVDDSEDGQRILDALLARTKDLRRRGVPVVDTPSDPQAPAGLFPPGYVGVQRPAAPAFLDIGRRSARAEIVEHAAMGHLEYVGFALERGWRPSTEALVKAAKYGHTEVVGLLLAFGLSAEEVFEGTTPLKEAIKRSHLATARLLVDSGAQLTSSLHRFVSDLPEDDKLRAFVMKTESIRPDSSIAEPAHKQDHSHTRYGHEDSPVKPEPTVSTLAKPESVESTAVDSRPKSEDGLNQSKEKQSKSSTPVETSHHQEKAESKQKEPFHEQKLSKLDLRSIKPKKRSKSAIASPDTSMAAMNIPDVSGSGLSETVTADDKPAPIGAHNGDVSHSAPATTVSTPLISSPQLGSGNLAPSTGSRKNSVVAASTTTTAASSRRPSRSGTPSNVESAPTTSEHPTVPVVPAVASVKWAERSQELSELAQLKEKQRRDREAKMLESLTQGSLRRSTSDSSLPAKVVGSPDSDASAEANNGSGAGHKSDGGTAATFSTLNSNRRLSPGVSPNASPLDVSSNSSPTASPNHTPSQISSPTLAQDHWGDHAVGNGGISTSSVEPVSVSHLPYAVRRLAYTGKPQAVLPLLIHEMAGVPHFIDLQVGLALGDAKIHAKHPRITKCVITAQQKRLLWPFCRSWLCRPGDSGSAVAECRRSFVDLHLCWLPVEQVQKLLFPDGLPPTVHIQLDISQATSQPGGHRRSSGPAAGASGTNTPVSVNGTPMAPSQAASGDGLTVASLPLRWQHKIMASW